MLFLQNVPMELLESTASGHVTADWLMMCAINQQENVRMAASLVLLALDARSVSLLNLNTYELAGCYIYAISI